MPPQPVSVVPPDWSSRQATQTGVLPLVSQIGAVPAQPESSAAPAASSTQGTHAGVVPSQTPPVQAVPASRIVSEHAPATHASRVHSFPSEQSAAVVHSTHTGVPPDVSQKGWPDPQPLSVVSVSSTHGTQLRAPALPTQSGEASVQPVSVANPVASSRQASHAGAVLAPSQTPVAQVVPAGSEVLRHTPASQASAVHSSPSSQSASARQPVQIGALPEVSQTGAPVPHPVSRSVPGASSMQSRQVGSVAAPSQTPLAPHASPRASEVLVQLPALQASVVQAFPSSQSAAPTHSTQAGAAPDVTQ
jgi:hypothetical protein